LIGYLKQDLMVKKGVNVCNLNEENERTSTKILPFSSQNVARS